MQSERSTDLRTLDWYHDATRWTQLTFTEDDPKTLDVDFWIDVMRRIDSRALCLSAGGYMAFYPTAVPHHYRSTFLGDSDPFGALVEGARSLGMHVMARIDPHATHEAAAQAHPEWIAHEEDGTPIRHASMPGVYWTDPFSTHHSEFVTEISREIVREYDVDAVFANRWEGHAAATISYSPGTAARFRADTGVDLPSKSNPGDPAWEVFAQWRSLRLSELVVQWDDAVRSVKPHVRFIPNRGMKLTRGLVPELVRDRYPFFVVDKQGRYDLDASWVAGRVSKLGRGLHPDRPVALLTSVGPESRVLRWKDAVANPDETMSLIVDGFAQGARPWFSKFKAECFDKRWVPTIEKAFALHARCEPVLGRLRYTAEIAVLDNAPATLPVPVPAADGEADDTGFYHALVQSRLPFEYIADEGLSLERLLRYRVLILPACRDLSPEHVAMIEQFVAAGGSVVSAFDSSVRGTGDSAELGLGELLGVRLVGGVRGPLKNKYMTIEREHDLSEGFGVAQRIVAGTRVLEVEAVGDAEEIFRFVPDYPDLPMEEVYPRPGRTSAAVVTRTHPSGGRTVHLAFNVGDVYWQALQSDHLRLITNAVHWCMGERRPQVEVRGAGLVDVAVQEGENERAVILVNLNNPMAMRGQLHEMLPMHDQEVLIQLPDGVTAPQARLVVADRPAPVEVRDGVARVIVERIEWLEIVHLTWAQGVD
nr:alpha-amylase family protein [Jiangella mangrovi]